MGPRSVRRRAVLEDLRNKQRDEIRAAAGRAQPPGDASGPPEAPARPASAAGRALRDRRDRRDAGRCGGRQRAARRRSPTGCRRSVQLRTAAGGDGPACSRDELEQRARRPPSRTATGPKCGRWSGPWCCRLLDTAWKDHLLVMDHLRNSVGLRGYAQVDPKVEYKREGMRTFEEMWDSVGERVTDLSSAWSSSTRASSARPGPRPRRSTRTPRRPGDRRAAAGGHRRHASRPQAASRSATASSASAATTPAPAAAARNSKSAAGGKRSS